MFISLPLFPELFPSPPFHWDIFANDYNFPECHTSVRGRACPMAVWSPLWEGHSVRRQRTENLSLVCPVFWAVSTWGPILYSAAPLFLPGLWINIAVAAVSYTDRACLSNVALYFTHGSVWCNYTWLCSAQRAVVVGLHTKWDFKHEWLFLMKKSFKQWSPVSQEMASLVTPLPT